MLALLGACLANDFSIALDILSICESLALTLLLSLYLIPMYK